METGRQQTQVAAGLHKRIWSRGLLPGAAGVLFGQGEKTSMGEVSRVRIASAIPGRVRLKVPRNRGMLEGMRTIADAFTSCTEVSDVQVNPQTGSILIRYDPERGSLEDLRLALQHLGIAIDQERDAKALPSFGGTVSKASEKITRKFSEMNARVGEATNGNGDLRFFFPLGLGAFTVHQIIRHGLKLEDIPWYATGWYAYQSFVSLNREAEQENQPADRSLDPPNELPANAGAQIT